MLQALSNTATQADASLLGWQTLSTSAVRFQNGLSRSQVLPTRSSSERIFAWLAVTANLFAERVDLCFGLLRKTVTQTDASLLGSPTLNAPLPDSDAVSSLLQVLPKLTPRGRIFAWLAVLNLIAQQAQICFGALRKLPPERMHLCLAGRR